MTDLRRRLAVGLPMLLVATLLGPAHAVATTGPTAPDLPCASPVLDEPLSGVDAVTELGNDLPDAAATADLSPARFRTMLRTDGTAHVDECGVTFFVEPERPERARGNASADSAQSATGGVAAFGTLDPSGDPFDLSSRPASQRTIFLDFDGHRVVNTVWNSAALPDVLADPFDTDGSPSTFSAAERDAIRSVWLHVAEDFAPFDVNVTTLDPGEAAITRTGAADQLYGTRALVTNSDELFASACDRECGGVAYLGVFDIGTSHAFYQPALIFQRGLAGGLDPKSLAESVSHEVGHNLGLDHDGKVTGGVTTSYYAGHAAWAPIMGVSYYRPLAQWSNGDYGGNNPENDVAVIASNGPALLADDHGDTASAATALTYDGPALGGIVTTRTDTDMFAFTVPPGAGTTSVRVAPQTVGGNLDARLEVYDAAEASLGSADPVVAATSADSATGLGASIELALPVGSYLARVDGVGHGTPSIDGYSDYASLGRYGIAVGSTSTVLRPVATTVPRGRVGAPYAVTLLAAGGVSPYTWSVIGGSLPDGLALTGPSTISGAPTAAGTWTATLRVTDSAGGDDTQTATTSLAITVDPAATPPVGTSVPPPADTTTPTTPTVPPTTPTTPTATTPAPAPVTSARFSGTLRTAISSLPVRAERPSGFTSTRFPIVNANRDCQRTPTKVLISESRSRTTSTSPRRCTVRTGSWYSYFDGRHLTKASAVTAVQTVPFSETWESGARGWTTARRRAYANDLADARTIDVVSRTSASARDNREVTRWLPIRRARCQYVARWTAVKIRWGLSVDSAEKARLGTVASRCAGVRIIVSRV